MINTVYLTLQAILNKENSGYLSPSEFNLLAKQVQDKIFRSYFEDINRDQQRENKGMSSKGHGNLVLSQQQRFAKLLATDDISIAGGLYALPSDLYFIEDDGISLSSNNRVVERMEQSDSNYARLSLASNSEVYPIYEHRGSNIIVFPTTITEDITIRYIRIPNDPNWTYTVVNGKEFYNPSSGSYQDFELHESEFSNIVLDMLTYFGINLREDMILKIAEQIKNTVNIKENT